VKRDHAWWRPGLDRGGGTSDAGLDGTEVARAYYLEVPTEIFTWMFSRHPNTKLRLYECIMNRRVFNKD